MSHPPPRPSLTDRRLPRCARGFTILEVALAATVLALGISTAIVAMQAGFRFLNVARDTTLASQILQSEIERLRLMNWTYVSVTLPPEENVDLGSMFSADSHLAARFKVTRKVTRDESRPDDVRFITLRVEWNSYDGRHHTRSFQTQYVRNGLYDYYYTLAGPPPTPP